MASLLKAQASRAALSCEVSREEIQEGGAPRRSQGSLKIKPGGRARFEITSPSAQMLVSDGSTLWMALPEARQVFRQETRSLRTSGQFFLDLTSSIRYYSKNSQARLRSAGPGFDPHSCVALELLPKDPTLSGFDKAVVWVDLNRWVVLQGELTSSGTLVRVKFNHIHAYSLAQVKADPSKRLPDKLFHYQPPKGWEVFDSLLP
jgi:outer membrane lipoprotein-sorting protein